MLEAEELFQRANALLALHPASEEDARTCFLAFSAFIKFVKRICRESWSTFIFGLLCCFSQ